MPVIEVRQHTGAGQAFSGPFPAPAEPALVVSFPDTGAGGTTPQTVGPFVAGCTLLTIFASADVKYEVATTGADADAGPKRGTIPAAALPYSMAVAQGDSIALLGG